MKPGSESKLRLNSLDYIILVTVISIVCFAVIQKQHLLYMYNNNMWNE